MKPGLIVFILLIVSLTSCRSKNDEVKEGKEENTVQTYESYFGMYSFPMDGETWDAQELPPVVIRTAEEFEDFRASIPEYEMTPRNPPPKSDDPLLTGSPADWSSRMMVAVFSLDQNTFIGLNIKEVAVKEGKLVVTYEYILPDPREIHQKIIDYGLYAALVIDRFDGEVVFVKEEVQSERD